MSINTIASRTGVSFKIKKGQFLSVIDPEGQQVSDLLAYNAADIKEVISSGRSLDYAENIYLTTNNILYSNRSNPMLTIVKDEVGRHDFTLTPCSKDTFRILYNDKNPHHGCFGNFEKALKEWGINCDDIPVAFNIFMNVEFDAKSGKISVLPPKSQAGQKIVFKAQMDLIIGLTACSAGESNNFKFKPIQYEVSDGE